MTERITQQDVRHVAKLSRLKLSEQEIVHFTQQLSHVLDYVAKLQSLDLEGVEPLTHPNDLSNVLREDLAGEALPIDAALANAPQRDDVFFGVPKVLGEGGGA